MMGHMSETSEPTAAGAGHFTCKVSVLGLDNIQMVRGTAPCATLGEVTAHLRRVADFVAQNADVLLRDHAADPVGSASRQVAELAGAGSEFECEVTLRSADGAVLESLRGGGSLPDVADMLEGTTTRYNQLAGQAMVTSIDWVE